MLRDIQQIESNINPKYQCRLVKEFLLFLGKKRERSFFENNLTTIKSFSFSKDFLKLLKNNIENGLTRDRFRTTNTAFVRQRCLGFTDLIYFMLGLGKSSVQQELDNFFSDKSVSYSKGAFSQQRSKLNPKVFTWLNEQQCSFYYNKASHIRKWKGFRLIGIDGSTLQLPYSKELAKGFGHFETRTENGRKVVLARVSQAYDVLNQISIDAKIKHYRTSELALCESHLPRLGQSDLLIMDRAYAAFWLMSSLVQQQKSFVIRVKANRWKHAKAFLASTQKQQIIEVSPSKEALNRCRERNIPTEALKLRLVRVPIASGEDHILITNLVDHKKYPVKEIRELYRKRWPVEESFKLLKTRAELENLSGKTARAVLQDFNRIILRANLSNILSKTLTKKGIDYCNKKRKNTYQINRTQAYRKTKSIIDQLKQGMDKIIGKISDYAFKLLLQLEIIRPNRSVPRIKRYTARPSNFITYKP